MGHVYGSGSIISAGVCATMLAASVAADTVYDISLVQDGVVNVTEYPVMPGRHDVVMGVSKWGAPRPTTRRVRSGA